MLVEGRGWGRGGGRGGRAWQAVGQRLDWRGWCITKGQRVILKARGSIELYVTDRGARSTAGGEQTSTPARALAACSGVAIQGRAGEGVGV